MSYTKELDRISKVVAENMLEQAHREIHWSMPADENLEGDEYMEIHNHILERAIYYISKQAKEKSNGVV